MNSGGTWMLCGFCGRPVGLGVTVGRGIFHEECTHGPGWQPTYFQPLPASEDRIRQIVREELSRRALATGGPLPSGEE